MGKRIAISFVCCMLMCFYASAQAVSLGCWLPYWEQNASMRELEELGPQFEKAVAFAAMFDREDKLLLPEDTDSLYWAVQMACAGTDTQVCLSVVNDVETSPGHYAAKDADLLRRLFADEAAMDAHIDDLLMLVDACRASYLEIDYENIKKDQSLWNQFARFIEKLYEVLERDGISLRVVLSWDAPKYMQLPKGPEYTVMCYNLYGYHSGPGPKADFSFLDQTAALYRNVDAKVRMAFATGGFVWKDDTVSQDLTQRQAEALAVQKNLTPVRDEASAALTAQYMENGQLHTLWYADAQTLRAWCDYMQEFDGFDFFRLGGNNLEDWKAHLGEDKQ